MTRHRLTLSAAALRAVLSHVSPVPLTFPAGWSRLPGSVEWLVHAAGTGPPDRPRLAAGVGSTPAELDRRLSHLADAAGCEAALVVGVGSSGGRLSAVRRTRHGPVPFERVSVMGPGMVTVGAPEEPVTAEEGERWSRSIGALGGRAWRRLRGLSVAVVGCGRSGSLAAEALARTGVRRLTLVDPDRLERHNLGEMALVSEADLGRSKVEAVGEALRALHADLALETWPASITDLAGLEAVKRAEVVFCCVDNPAARLATGTLAVLYLRPLLDVGTAVLPGVLGADVRLVLPGRCLLCLGGVAEAERGRAELHGQTRAERVWRVERAGSLHSLNGLAVHLGMRLVEELVTGRRAESAWLHLERGADGVMRWQAEGPGSVGCRLCALAGYGDGGLTDLRELLGDE
jgi:hypothetical protein